jgi:hypothetical protein
LSSFTIQRTELRNKVVEFAYSSQALDSDVTKEFLDSIMVGQLEKLERWRSVKMSKGSGPFMVGSNATAPDFGLW